MKEGFRLGSKIKTKKVKVYSGTIAGDGIKHKIGLILDQGYEEAVKYARKTEMMQWERDTGEFGISN